MRLETGQRIVATFLYEDGDGRLLYRKHRIEPGEDGRSKSFRFDRPNGAGSWLPGTGGEAVPYRLRDLASAPKDVPLFMAEGERKADKLASWGLLATSLKDWKGFEFSGYVRGRTVFILPDNDTTGDQQARRAQEGVETAGGKAHRIELPGLGEGEDILDWAGTLEDLQRLADREASARSRLPVIDFAHWGGPPPARESAWGDWLPLRQTTMLTGSGGTGKSLLTQMLSTCIAIGRPFLGMDTRGMNALYVTAEDDAEELWRRQHSICLSLGVPLQSLSGRLHLVSLAGEAETALASFDHDGRMKVTDRWQQVREVAEAENIRFGAFDNATDMMAGEHNDVHQVAGFVNLLTGFAIDRDGVSMILHHPNKNGDDWLGSIGWHNKVRSRLIIKRPDGGDPDARIIENPKANYSQTGNQIAFRWHEGAFVRDQDLSADTARQLREVSVANGENAAFLACLRARASQGDGREVGPSPGPNYAPAQFEGMAEAKGYRKPALKRAMERLFAIGAIRSATLRDRKANRDKIIIVEAVEPLHNAAHNGSTTHSHNGAQPPAQPRTT
ncbi:MAG: hypothetical protein EPO57_09165, partial [Chitinophagaceae bacterium]